MISPIFFASRRSNASARSTTSGSFPKAQASSSNARDSNSPRPRSVGSVYSNAATRPALFTRLSAALAGVGSNEYDELLRKTLWDAEGVLVLNRLTEAMLSPFAQRVHVVPWGMDPKRFEGYSSSSPVAGQPLRLLLAGIPEEAIKGYHIAQEACSRLWERRRDFELVVTGDPAGQVNEFTRFVGWHSQEELPKLYRWADVVLVPTIAQEGLSRTSVEAMASGKPVIGSRIGGLPETISDGSTGFLVRPGDPEDLADKITLLLDDPELRTRMGQAGRRRFEQDFTWPTVIERYYRPLLKRREQVAST